MSLVLENTVGGILDERLSIVDVEIRLYFVGRKRYFKEYLSSHS